MKNPATMWKVAATALTCAPGALFAAKTANASAAARPQKGGRLNLLLITADDLNCSTTPMFGCRVDALMPNIERLSGEGMLFRRAHVTSAVSQPSRGALMTGLYPHNSGVDGFYHTPKDVASFQETLQAAGYRIGIMGKVEHSTPKASIKWDYAGTDEQTHSGRDPQAYYKAITAFIARCKAEGRPFFFMGNSQDPHRPFAGSRDEVKKLGGVKNYPDPARIYKPSEVEVPGFLPDLSDVRVELAQYYSSVHRLDESVGQMLRAIKDAGVENNTLVIFLSDNGMSMPFSKTNNYLHSTHTPLIVKWPGVTKAGSEDDTHFINGIDFMPTALEALGIAVPKGLDGRSFLPLLQGMGQDGRDCVFTEFTENSARAREPMRAVQDEHFGYIYNVWSDGTRQFSSETFQAMAWAAMKKAAAAGDEAIAARVRVCLYRTPEEFYDYAKDPDALHNLIDDPAYRMQIDRYRALLDRNLEATGDPVLAPFRARGDKAAAESFMQSQAQLVRDRQRANAQQGGKGKRPADE